MREQSNTSEIEPTSEQTDDLLRSIREEPGSPVHFPVPPPDVEIDHQVQSKLSSKRRKTNSSVQSPKKDKDHYCMDIATYHIIKTLAHKRLLPYRGWVSSRDLCDHL